MMLSGRNIKKDLSHFVIYVILLSGSVVVVLPLLWQITISLKSSNTIFEIIPRFFPSEFKFSNYSEAVVAMNFLKYFNNTLFISFMTIVGTLFSCIGDSHID